MAHHHEYQAVLSIGKAVCWQFGCWNVAHRDAIDLHTIEQTVNAFFSDGRLDYCRLVAVLRGDSVETVHCSWRSFEACQDCRFADAVTAETLALRATPPAFLQLVRAARACLLAATGQPHSPMRVLEQLHHGESVAASDEAHALARLAEVLLLADGGDLEGARSLLDAMTVEERAVRSSVWKAALDTALLPSLPSHLAESAGHYVALGRAVAAGQAAAIHPAGGPPAGEHRRPYLPAQWCTRTRRSMMITPDGTGRVVRDFRSVDHPAWGAPGCANSACTLTRLLDVLDPYRVKASDTALIVVSAGSLRFSRDTGMHIDIWDTKRLANAILATSDHERPLLLAHARRLVKIEPGQLLDGVTSGEWLEPHRRRLDDLVVTASLHAGVHALGAADHGLAEALGLRILAVDPGRSGPMGWWSRQGCAVGISTGPDVLCSTPWPCPMIWESPRDWPPLTSPTDWASPVSRYRPDAEVLATPRVELQPGDVCRASDSRRDILYWSKVSTLCFGARAPASGTATHRRKTGHHFTRQHLICGTPGTRPGIQGNERSTF